jgi:hypothetical protein
MSKDVFDQLVQEAKTAKITALATTQDDIIRATN